MKRHLQITLSVRRLLVRSTICQYERPSDMTVSPLGAYPRSTFLKLDKILFRYVDQLAAHFRSKGHAVVLTKSSGYRQGFGSGSGFLVSLDPDPRQKKSGESAL